MKIRVRETRLVVPGFRFAGVAAGIKPSGRPDVALIHSDRPATIAGAFTRNRVKAAPVVIATRHVRNGRAQAVLINSGNANACTGVAGARVAITACRRAASGLGLSPYDVVPCSTGKIGEPLAEKAIISGVDEAIAALSPDGLWRTAHAMMTTDAFPKVAHRRVRIGGRMVTVAGLAKGAGMIAPDVATLIVCVLTDAAVTAPRLRAILADGVATSFNAITVDGDCSTNDTVLLVANGAAANAPLGRAGADTKRFTTAVAEVMAALADMVVADGEGATRRARITVSGARTDADARRAARAIAESQLVKTALHGGDPNWGRIVCAAGYAGVPLVPDRVTVQIGDVVVLRRGEPASSGAVKRAAALMRRDLVAIRVDLAAGRRGTATITTSDLSPAYVRFNAEYST